MKLNTVDNVIERSGDLQDEAGFTIALTAKAIEVLSSGIYKDAPLAIVRELGTNAADSHIEAGKRAVPFDVILPNVMTPELVIRDFGTGMSYEKVMKMYTTYFGSDKTNSDEVTGCLGLGSKSPLAYTDQFQVTSWFGGEKSVYTIYKNEKGLPAINRIYSDKSDEPTGVEVRISIKRHDFHMFRQKALETYRWFTPRPNVGGVHESEWPKDEIALSTDTWKIRKDTQKRMVIVMGNVAYYVDKTDLGPIYDKLSRAERTLCDCGPILNVDIGDVDIAASRETLKFDGPKTYPTIKRLLGQMAKEVAQNLQTSIDACKTHWEARKEFKKLKNTQPLGLVLPDDLKWKGLELRTQIKLQEVDDNYKLTKDFANCRKYFMRRHRRSFGWSVSTMTVNIIDCEEDAHLFVVEGKNHISRVSHFVRQSHKGNNNYAVAYVLTPADQPQPVTNRDGTVTIPDHEVWKLEDFFKDQHLTDVVRKTSELPDPPKNMSGLRSKSHQILKPLGNPSRYASSHWTAADVDFDEGGVYVEVKANFWNAGTLVERKASELIALTSLVEDEEVVGVRHRELKDFEAADQWVRLDKYITDKYKDNEPARIAAVKADVWRRCRSSYNMNLLSHIMAFKPQFKDGLFAKMYQTFIQLEKDGQNALAKAYTTALPFLGKALDSNAEYAEVLRQYRAFENRYPMLKILNTWSDKKAIAHYIGLVDGLKLHTKKPKRKKRLLPELQEA